MERHTERQRDTAALVKRDVEVGGVRVPTAVRHGEQPGLAMLDAEVLIVELVFSVDAASACNPHALRLSRQRCGQKER